MATVDSTEALIETGRIDEVEDLWLSRQAQDPTDLDFFRKLAGQLAKARETDAANFLLELLDEQLSESGAWRTRLELLRDCGPIYLEPAAIHAAAMATLEKLYPESENFEGLKVKAGLTRAIEDTPKTWTKIARLESLLQYEVGTFVWMTGKGPGCVVEVNLELESFKIRLRDGTEIRVGFAAAAKMLETLDASHIERRKLEDLDALLRLKADHPGELLILALESRGKPLSAAQVRQALEGVVEESEWNSWWQRARKHPRVLMSSSRGRQTYSLAASEDHALDDVRRRFAAADVAGKLEILRRNADRSESLADEMLTELRSIAESTVSDEPATALEIWFTLERFRSDTELSWTPATVVAEAKEPVALVRALRDKTLRERLYELFWSERADAPALYHRCFEYEQDPRLLSSLAQRLHDKDPSELRGAVDDILGHPRRRPGAFVWLAEHGDKLEVFEGRSALRVIRQILDALHQSEFSRFKSRLQGTFETGGGATQLFARLTEDQAAQAEQAVKSAPLDEHLQDELVRYLHVRFPSLDASREATLYATPATIEMRRQELHRLQTEQIPANRKAIEEARELGDLRENFEYKSARQRHEYLNARLAALKSDLSRVVPLDVAGIDASEVRVGCRVDLRTAEGASRSITILGPWESDPENDIVSYDSELGQSLLGKKQGDAVIVEGLEWKVRGISVSG